MERTDFLPYCQHWLGEEEIQEVMDTLRSPWITTGPKAKAFEEAFRAYIGCRHAIATNSGTSALHLALAGLGIGEGDEVITTPYTFCATVEAIEYQRARPVLADIQPETFNIDPAQIQAKVSPRTRAILPVHFGGQACPMDEIMALASQRGLMVVEDAAHAAGARYKGRMVGTIGHVTAFSFYPTKNMTTGEGGMATTDDQALAERMRAMSLHGMSSDAWMRYSERGSWKYQVLCLGYKYNMTDIQASLGLHQLARLEKFNQVRSRYARIYLEGLADLEEIILPRSLRDRSHAWHLFVILIRPERLTIGRDEFIEELRQRGIGTSVHFIPIHLHPYYRKRHGWAEGDFPASEWVYQRAISLPLYPKMTEADLERVMAAVRETVAANLRR